MNILRREKEWCVQNKINFTPEILVNGRSFPLEYERSDLLYFIDDIIDEEKQRVESLKQELKVMV